MPLVEIHKARRRAIRRRPEWQDTRPPEKELRAAYDIAARHVQRFSNAYAAMTRELLTPAVLKKMRRALQENDVDGAVKAIPSFKKTDPAGEAVWAKLGKKLRAAFIDVMTEAGENEFRREKIPLKFVVAKVVEPPPTVPTIPVNPWSLKWIEAESSDLIKEVSLNTQETVRGIINRGFAEGRRSDSMIKQIGDRVGLLKQEDNAVQRRMLFDLSQGVPEKVAEDRAKRYAAQLLKKRANRVARSELITAQSKGRRHAWADAKKNGELPSTVEREWAAVVGSPRTCEICEGLDGQRVALGENYHSDVLGREVEGPGMDAHPQ